MAAAEEEATVATKTSTSKAARTFDVLMPRLARAEAGVTFETGSFVRKTGTVPAQLKAVRLSGSPLGTHAASRDSGSSLCGLPLVASGKSTPKIEASGQAAKVALTVACRFCQARLVGAGLLDAKAEGVSSYAADYGSRNAEAELAAIEQRASKAKA
jgi:hypothetical protein